MHNDLNITVVTSTKTLNVTYPSYLDREGYTINSCTAETLPTSVLYGSNLCFKANIMANYEIQTGGIFVVRNNGVIINETGTGIYVINNIISDVVITIDNSDVIRETVNLTYDSSDKYSLINLSTGTEVTSTLNKGDIANLSIVIDPGHIGSIDIDVNDGELVKTCGVGDECLITVQIVTVDIDISIDDTNLRKAEHNVTY